MTRPEPSYSVEPAGRWSRTRSFLGDRIQLNSIFIVLCFISVLALESQSAASYPTYLLALAMILWFREWDDVFHQKMLWLTIGLLGYLSLSSFWSEPFVWRDAVTVFSRALLVFFFVVAVAECQLRGQLKRWIGRALAVVGIFAVLAAMAVHFADPPHHGRLNGLGQLDTQVIAALVYGICLLFVLDVLITDRSAGWRAVAGFSGIIIVYAIFLSDSRNAWVSVMLGAGTFLLAHCVTSRQRFMAAVAAFALVFGTLIAALILNPETSEAMLPRGDSFRPEIWSEIWSRIVADGLWFGLGINTSDNVFAAGRELLHPHSMYLSVMYQGGAIAFALFAALLIHAVRTLLVHYHHHDAKLAIGTLGVALPAYLLDGHELVDKVGPTWFLLWFPIAVALGFRWSEPRGDLADIA